MARRPESPGAALVRRRWAKNPPTTESTAPARAAFMRRFEQNIDPAITDPAERARLADEAKRAYFRALSARARGAA